MTKCPEERNKKETAPLEGMEGSKQGDDGPWQRQTKSRNFSPSTFEWQLFTEPVVSLHPPLSHPSFPIYYCH